MGVRERENVVRWQRIFEERREVDETGREVESSAEIGNKDGTIVTRNEIKRQRTNRRQHTVSSVSR